MGHRDGGTGTASAEREKEGKDKIAAVLFRCYAWFCSKRDDNDDNDGSFGLLASTSKRSEYDSWFTNVNAVFVSNPNNNGQKFYDQGRPKQSDEDAHARCWWLARLCVEVGHAPLHCRM